MNEIINLIRLTHPQALNAAIFAAENGTIEEAEEAAAELLAALYIDDTFNQCTESELLAAISEATTEYN